MNCYIQKYKPEQLLSINHKVAEEGFRLMGFHIEYFYNINELSDNKDKEIIVVGSIGSVQQRLLQLEFPIPECIDYPKELYQFLGRKIWKSSINTIANNPDNWGIFIKPAKSSKKFTGIVVKNTKSLIGCGDQLEDTEIWCSEAINFLAEWRCFVRYGEILDVRMYKGDWRLHFDYKIIEKVVKSYKTAPSGYSIDFGLTDTNETLIVECNDGYSLGSYGLTPINYAKLISARWSEITNTKDFCLF